VLGYERKLNFEPLLLDAVARVALGIEGKVPPKAAGPTSKFGSEFPVNLR